jgi:hypothetical protein
MKFYVLQLIDWLPNAEADKPAKAHKTIFAPNNIYYFIFKRNKTIKRTPLERNFCDLNY